MNDLETSITTEFKKSILKWFTTKIELDEKEYFIADAITKIVSSICLDSIVPKIRIICPTE
jgi:hypothetical protein